MHLRTRSLLRCSFLTICLLLGLSTLVYGDDEAMDTREGEDVTLKCRFHLQPLSNLTYFWLRNNKQNHDSVAIGDVPLDKNYKLDYRPEQGRYDLLIKNASYDRDNGRFECRVKAGGSGDNLHEQSMALTVLAPPKQPVVSPGNRAVATEGRPLELTCSSTGGSPDPVIRWYRDDSQHPLEASLKYGGSRDQPTSSTLRVTPAKEDDGAVFRCSAWNRAMPAGARLDAAVSLSVNYFPRVSVGPSNPLSVERDSTATLVCSVEAKPEVTSVKWMRDDVVISTAFKHTIHRVSETDAGRYTCTADNMLGRADSKEIMLDVLYPPIVVIESKTRETEEGEMVNIRCNVTSNPAPISIEWVKEGKPDFRQSGEVLRLARVDADSAGTYWCRATNILINNNRQKSERVGNSSIALLVRHRPGRAKINPSKPVAQEGSGVTLRCTASPPGWPAPQFRWFRDGDSDSVSGTVLATGSMYTIPSAHLGSEGTYHCQAINELGQGDMASINLEVYQPPRFLSKLQPHMTRRVGDTDFSVTCSAHGKPKPLVHWLKDGQEITPDVNLYEVKSDTSSNHNAVVTVISTLRFMGKARPDDNQLLPGDRGVYSCVYENEVRRAESTMHLRIEHAPIVLHQYDKVAYETRETAEVVCKIQAYPKPEFHWSFGSSSADITSDKHYEINTSTDNNDVYTSILKIDHIRHNDYGEYNCRVVNSLGNIKTPIRLQPKGPPEKPKNLQTLEVGSDYVSLFWDPGFDGGLSNTKFFVSYRKLAVHKEDFVPGDCASVSIRNSDWLEFDCQRNMPCNISSLDQHQNYEFKVKALNTKGNSDYSNEITTTTKVDRIPAPQQVTFDPSTKTLSIRVGATCLSLIGIVESIVNSAASPLNMWQIVETIPVQVSGNGPTYKNAVIEHLNVHQRPKSTGRTISDEGVYMAVEEDLGPGIRMKLCLKTNHEHCGDYTNAEIGPSYIKEASALATPTLIAIIVSCIVFLLFVGLLLMFCRCKRKNQSKKASAKDYEMDSVRPSIVAQQNQAPPPYYPATGLENKALEHSMDLAMAMEDPKNSVYATQNGYGYHPNPTMQQHQGMMMNPNINGNEWVNMGYMDNSYSNSNNGGSVNSQDSLWQMKMAAAANNGGNVVGNNLIPVHHNNMTVDRQNSYGGYDPLAHGGYGTADDYAHYPQSNHGGVNNGVDDYHVRASQNPSRQEYVSDPYAAVHKPKKRMDQHLDSPYHDVSGLPDPYMDQPMEQQMDQPMEPIEQKPPQHMSLSYDESLESGYSTPNSRNRRVIREIIV